MAELTIRDPYGNEFQIDATARPFWEHREGYEIVPEPAPAETTPAPLEESGIPKPMSKKAAPRPASEDKE